MHSHFLAETEMRKARSKEEKKAEKEEKDKIAKEYGFALLDGYKQKIGNFRIEPPGLFRGRGFSFLIIYSKSLYQVNTRKWVA